MNQVWKKERKIITSVPIFGVEKTHALNDQKRWFNRLIEKKDELQMQFQVENVFSRWSMNARYFWLSHMLACWSTAIEVPAYVFLIVLIISFLSVFVKKSVFISTSRDHGAFYSNL